MKTDLLKNLSFGVGQRSMTTRNIAEAVLVLMQNHIGYDNNISKNDLFYKLFRKELNDNDIKDWLRWEFVKKAMHFCRVYTNCFIGLKSENGTYKYFVLSNENDLSYYNDMLENSIRKMKLMQIRARKSIKEEWYKDKWLISKNDVGLITNGNGK